MIGTTHADRLLPLCVGPVIKNRFHSPESIASYKSRVYGCRRHENRSPLYGPSGITISASANSRIVRSFGTRQRDSIARSADRIAGACTSSFAITTDAIDQPFRLVNRLIQNCERVIAKLPPQLL